VQKLCYFNGGFANSQKTIGKGNLMSGNTDAPGGGTRLVVPDGETIMLSVNFLTAFQLCMNQTWFADQNPPDELVGNPRIDRVVGRTVSLRTRQLFSLARKLKQMKLLIETENNPVGQTLIQDYIQATESAMFASLLTEFPVLCDSACLKHTVLCQNWTVVVHNERWNKTALFVE